MAYVMAFPNRWTTPIRKSYEHVTSKAQGMSLRFKSDAASQENTIFNSSAVKLRACRSTIGPEGTFVACGADGIFAIVIVPCLIILTVGLGDIPVKRFTATGTFQNTAQDMRMLRIIDLLPAISVFLPFLLCKAPVRFRNDRLILPLIHREL